MKLLVHKDNNKVIGTFADTENIEALPEDRKAVAAPQTEIDKFTETQNGEEHLVKEYFWNPSKGKVGSNIVKDNKLIPESEKTRLKGLAETDPEKAVTEIIDIISKLGVNSI